MLPGCVAFTIERILQTKYQQIHQRLKLNTLRVCSGRVCVRVYKQTRKSKAWNEKKKPAAKANIFVFATKLKNRFVKQIAARH